MLKLTLPITAATLHGLPDAAAALRAIQLLGLTPERVEAAAVLALKAAGR